MILETIDDHTGCDGAGDGTVTVMVVVVVVVVVIDILIVVVFLIIFMSDCSGSPHCTSRCIVPTLEV